MGERRRRRRREEGREEKKGERCFFPSFDLIPSMLKEQEECEKRKEDKADCAVPFSFLFSLWSFCCYATSSGVLLSRSLLNVPCVYSYIN